MFANILACLRGEKDERWRRTLTAAVKAHGIVGLTREPEALAEAASASPVALAAAAREWMKADAVGRAALADMPRGEKKEALTRADVLARRADRGAWPAEETAEAAGHAAARSAAEGVASDRGLFSGLFGKMEQVLRIPDEPVDGVVEDGGEAVKVYHNERFSNWGRTIKAVPSYTFVPRTRRGVVEVVRFAARENLRVRAAGARHSWSDVFGRDGDVLISFMELGEAVPKTDLGVLPANKVDRPLEHIAFEGAETGTDGVTRGRVRVGAAATSEHMRAWALRADGGEYRWMLPVLPILVETTSAGVTQVICHGAGRRHKSCSDFVVEVEVVNCKGEIQVIRDPRLIKSAAGGLGLFGIVLSQVFLMDPLEIAVLKPESIPTLLAVPPVPDEQLPEQDDFRVEYTKEEVEAGRARFLKECDSFYSEWFWFPFQEKCWVNCWDTEQNVGGGKPAEYLSEKEVVGQNAQLALLSALETTLMRLLPAEWQTRLVAGLTMATLPSGTVERIGVPDALHFQRGIHQLRVRDIELEIEIPGRPDGKPDFSICQRAWWAGIDAIYAHKRKGRTPVRVALEMRILGGSDVTLCTQRGNNFGTCSIEVLTNTLTGEREWEAFRDEITERWEAVAKKYGSGMRVLPHWAKEWPSKMGGHDIMEYMKEEYANASAEFLTHLSAAGSEGGYSVDDALQMLGNPTVVEILRQEPGKSSVMRCEP